MTAFNVVFPAMLTCAIFANLQTDLIEKFLITKNVRVVSVVDCLTKPSQVKIWQQIRNCPKHLKFLHINTKTIFKKLQNYPRQTQIVLILNLDCPNSGEFLKECTTRGLFNRNFHWLLITKSLNFEDILRDVDILIDADVEVAVFFNETDWIMFDVYKSGRLLPLRVRRIGNYNISGTFLDTNSATKYDQRRNMSGVNVKSKIVLNAPPNYPGTIQDYLYSEKKRIINSLDRFHGRLTLFCSNIYMFNLHIKKVKSYGYPLPNGDFDGIVGALIRKEIDLSASPLFLREDRMRYVDYGKDTWRFKGRFIFRSPKDPATMQTFFKPLSSHIWLITALLAAISILLLKLAMNHEESMFGGANIENNWSLLAIITFGILCQQGSSISSLACGRITTFTLVVLSLCVYQFYSASIVSNLLRKPTDKITNVSDLAMSSLKVACEDINYNRELFAHTKDATIKNLYWKKMAGQNNASNFYTIQEGLRLIQKGGWAFHVDVAKVYDIIAATFPEEMICELREADLFQKTLNHAVYQKGSPYRDIMETWFNNKSLACIYREFRFWNSEKPTCPDANMIVFHIGLDEFLPVILILAIGIFTSLLILSIEKSLVFIKGHP